MQLDIDEIQTTRGEKALAFVLALFLLIGLAWGVRSARHARAVRAAAAPADERGRGPRSRSSPTQRPHWELPGRPARLHSSTWTCAGSATGPRSTPAAPLRCWRRGTARPRRRTSPRVPASRTRAHVSPLPSPRRTRPTSARRARARHSGAGTSGSTFFLRLAFVLGLLGAAYGVLHVLRGSRYYTLGLAGVVAAALMVSRLRGRLHGGLRRAYATTARSCSRSRESCSRSARSGASSATSGDASRFAGCARGVRRSAASPPRATRPARAVGARSRAPAPSAASAAASASASAVPAARRSMASDRRVAVPAGVVALLGAGVAIFFAVCPPRGRLRERGIRRVQHRRAACNSSSRGLGVLPVLCTLALAVWGRGHPLRWFLLAVDRLRHVGRVRHALLRVLTAARRRPGAAQSCGQA